MEEQQNHQGSRLSPKASFALGILAAIAVFSIIGFGILLKLYLKGGTPSVVTTGSGAQAAPQQPAGVIDPITDTDHIRGDKNAKVSIIEYSDFECPFCKQFHPIVKSMIDEYKGKVSWVYRQFPLDSIHPNARKEAEASECAAEQGKFWEFTDKIFERTKSNGYGFALDDLPKLAKELGLDTNKFNQCFTSSKYASHVEEQLQSGIKAGVKGTPGSFINGLEIPGAVPAQELKKVVDQALSKV